MNPGTVILNLVKASPDDFLAGLKSLSNQERVEVDRKMRQLEDKHQDEFSKDSGRREQTRRGFLSTLGLGAAGVGAAVASKLLPGGKTIGDQAPPASAAPAPVPGLPKQTSFKHPLRLSNDTAIREGLHTQLWNTPDYVHYQPLREAFDKYQELANLPGENMTREQMAHGLKLAKEIQGNPALHRVKDHAHDFFKAEEEVGEWGDLSQHYSVSSLEDEGELWRAYGLSEDEIGEDQLDGLYKFVDNIRQTNWVAEELEKRATHFRDKARAAVGRRMAVEDALRSRGIDVGEPDELDELDQQLWEEAPQ